MRPAIRIFLDGNRSRSPSPLQQQIEYLCRRRFGKIPKVDDFPGERRGTSGGNAEISGAMLRTSGGIREPGSQAGKIMDWVRESATLPAFWLRPIVRRGLERPDRIPCDP